jgi:hypothetical protein
MGLPVPTELTTIRLEALLMERRLKKMLEECLRSKENLKFIEEGILEWWHPPWVLSIIDQWWSYDYQGAIARARRQMPWANISDFVG